MDPIAGRDQELALAGAFADGLSDGPRALVWRASGSGRAPDPTAVGVGFRSLLDNIDAAVVRALGGSDTITVGDLSGTGLERAGIDLSATGGGGDAQADTVVVNGRERADRVDVTRSGEQVLVAGLPALTTISGSEGLNDTLRLNTLGGDDQVTIDPDPELLITPVIDLGADE